MICSPRLKRLNLSHSSKRGTPSKLTPESTSLLNFAEYAAVKQEIVFYFIIIFITFSWLSKCSNGGKRKYSGEVAWSSKDLI